MTVEQQQFVRVARSRLRRRSSPPSPPIATSLPVRRDVAPDRRLVRDLTLVLAVTAMAFVLRMARLTYFNLSGDETISATFSVQSPASIIDALRHGEPHPPLLYVLYHFWIPLTGDSEFSMRFPAVAAGTVTVPLIYVVGKRLLAIAVGLIAAFLVATNPYQLWNAQDARMYTLATFLCLGALYATARWYGLPARHRNAGAGGFRVSRKQADVATSRPLDQHEGEGQLSARCASAGEAGLQMDVDLPLWQPRHDRARWLCLYTACMTLALYTHYYSVYIIVLLNVFAAVRALSGVWRRYPPWLLAQVVTSLLFLPWLVAASETIRTYHGNGYQPGLAEALRRWLGTFFFGYVVTRDPPPVVTTLILALLLCGIAVAVRRSPWSALLLVLALLLPVVGVFVASISRPVFNERYLMAASPAFYVLVAALVPVSKPGRYRCVAWLRGGVILCVVALYVGLAHRYETMTTTVAKSRDAGAFGAYLAEHAAPGDRVLFNLIDPTFDYYYRHAGGRAPVIVAPLTKDEDDAALDVRLGRQLDAAPRVWFIPDGMKWWDTRQIVPAWMDRHYLRRNETNVSISIVEYDAVPNRHPLTVLFGTGPRLVGTDLADATPVATGKPWTVTLLWQAASALTVSYTVSIQVLSPAGQLVAQSDGIPQSGKAPTTSWRTTETIPDPHVLTLPSGTAAGSYVVAVAVYDSATLQRLPVGGHADRLVPLGSVTVTP